jgi:hypothetical protein
MMPRRSQVCVPAHGEPGRHESRVKGVHRHPAGGQPSGELEGEIEVHQLGGAVDERPPVGPGHPLEIVEIETTARLRMTPRRHHHDPGGSALAQAVEKQLAQQEVTEVIGLELCLVAVLGLGPARQHAAGVQIEHVDGVETFEQLVGTGAHRGQAGQVEPHAVDIVVAAGPADVGHGRRPSARRGAP